MDKIFNKVVENNCLLKVSKQKNNIKRMKNEEICLLFFINFEAQNLREYYFCLNIKIHN